MNPRKKVERQTIVRFLPYKRYGRRHEFLVDADRLSEINFDVSYLSGLEPADSWPVRLRLIEIAGTRYDDPKRRAGETVFYIVSDFTLATRGWGSRRTGNERYFKRENGDSLVEIVERPKPVEPKRAKTASSLPSFANYGL